MEKNIEKFYNKLKAEKKKLNKDDSFFVDKDYYLDKAIKHLEEAQSEFEGFKKTPTDLVKKGKKHFTYDGKVFILEWTNHYEKRYIEIDFLYPMSQEKYKWQYHASDKLEAHALKLIDNE